MKSDVAAEWPELLKSLETEYKQTKENTEYLSTIIEYLIVMQHL